MTERIWAPWRMDFIRRVHQRRDKKCIFCSLPKKKAGPGTLVLYRGKRAYVILNRYPYINGHLMVVPCCHLASFERLKPEEHQELGMLVGRAIRALKKEYHAQGFNVGLNLGTVAGAGIKGHIHYHVIPRWRGDSNIMPVLANTRVVLEALGTTYQRLKKYF